MGRDHWGGPGRSRKINVAARSPGPRHERAKGAFEDVPLLFPGGHLTLEEIFRNGPCAELSQIGKQAMLVRVQRFLREKGIIKDNYVIKMTKDLQRGLVDYQKSVGLRLSGEVDAETLAKAKLKTLTNRLPGETYYKNMIGMNLLFIPPDFSDARDAELDRDFSKRLDSESRYEEGFFMAQFETTQAHWEAVMKEDITALHRKAKLINSGLVFRAPTPFKRHPVYYVDQQDGLRFSRALSNADQPRLREQGMTDWAYTLPTSEQWSYACLAGGNGKFAFGNIVGDLHLYGNFADISAASIPGIPHDPTQNDGSKYINAVGSYRANAWGLRDMHGNVWEWVINPGKRGQALALGGAYINAPNQCEATSSWEFAGNHRVDQIGFRVVLVPSG